MGSVGSEVGRRSVGGLRVPVRRIPTVTARLYSGGSGLGLLGGGHPQQAGTLPPGRGSQRHLARLLSRRYGAIDATMDTATTVADGVRLCIGCAFIY